MEENQHKNISYEIYSDKKPFKLYFSTHQKNLEIIINNELALSSSYIISFQIEDFFKLNKYFRQFDSILEIYDFITNIEKLEEKIKIKIEDKFAKLKILIPSISKIKENIEIEIILPEIKLKENDLILKLCEKAEKIDILEKKINLLYKYLILDFENFKIESKIINDIDILTISIGIKKTMKKKIKNLNLLYRASRDGNHTQFHSRCNGKENTITFVKSKNGRRFGGFANKPFSNGDWDKIVDYNAFVFSLDFNECYYCNNNSEGFPLYGSLFYGPIWGYGHDLCLDGDCLKNDKSTTRQSSFNYNGKNDALSGGINFQVEDYETYELILE